MTRDELNARLRAVEGALATRVAGAREILDAQSHVVAEGRQGEGCAQAYITIGLCDGFFVRLVL